MDSRKSTHTFTFIRDGMEKEEKYDVHKLWELSKGLLSSQFDVAFLVGRMSDRCHPYKDPIQAEKRLRRMKDFTKILKLQDHLLRVKEADLRYPILVGPDSIGVIDGHHRLVKAHQLGISHLFGKKFEKMPKEARIF